MTPTLTRNPTAPTPDQGAITVWSERAYAVSAFRISAPAGAVQVLDLDGGHTLPAANPVAVEDALGPIVFEDVAAYKRSSAWRLATVLEALGLDASELEPVELEEISEDPDAATYDFTRGPAGEQLGAAAHAAAWAAHMEATAPIGYVVEGIGGRVEWACPARPSEGRTVAFYIDALAESWRAFLQHDAEVLADLLALAGVWEDGLGVTDGVQAGRTRWIGAWTLLERGQAAWWAACVHLSASDHDDVVIPPRPACLDSARPARSRRDRA